MKEMVYGDTTCNNDALAVFNYYDYKIVVKNIRGSHPCAYIKLPADHPFSKLFTQDDIYDLESEIDCQLNNAVHGGITLAGTELTYDGKSEVGYWIGWDYAHWGDYTYTGFERGHNGEKKWTVEEILIECGMVLAELINAEEAEE